MEGWGACLKATPQDGPLLLISDCNAQSRCKHAITHTDANNTTHRNTTPTNDHHQEAALRHALTFPALRRLAYSTCSTHQRENEDVVAAVLPDAQAAGFDLVDPFPGGGWTRRGVDGSLPGGREALVIRTDAYEDGTDGFFVAVFERVAGKGGGSGGGGQGGGGELESGEQQAPQQQRLKRVKDKKKIKKGGKSGS